MKKLDKYYLKTIILLLGSQAILYFIIKGIQFFEPVVLVTIIDEKIPLIKHFIWIYDLWYPFLVISLYYLYKQDKKSYQHYLWASIIGVIISDIIFVLFPSTVPRPELLITDLSSFVLSLTYQYDTPLNCLPSIHCLLCFVLIIINYQNKKLSNNYKVITSTISWAIILSTLFVKQHVILDAIASFIIALITVKYVEKKHKKNRK